MDDPLIKINQIGDLFSRYKKRLKPPQLSIEKITYRVIEDVTPLKIPLKKIKYTVGTKTLSINVPSVVKSELTFYKKDILKALENELGINNSPKHLF